MLNVLKLGHAEFEVQDVERMAEFYSSVIGLTETGRDGQTIYLSTSIDHHSIVLRGGASKTRLSKRRFRSRRSPTATLPNISKTMVSMPKYGPAASPQLTRSSAPKIRTVSPSSYIPSFSGRPTPTA
jgi:hypothetical protein